MGLISRVSSRTYRETVIIKWWVDRLSNERFSRDGRSPSQPRTSRVLVSPKFSGTTWPTHRAHSVIHSWVQSTSPITCQPRVREPRTIHLSFQLEIHSE